MTPLSIVGLVASALVALALIVVSAHRRRQARERYLDAFRFPPGIGQKVRKRYPQLTDDELELVFRALRDYFHLCRKARGRLLSMPSQVVDVAWHEFILFTRNYQAFCSRALGRFLHHTPTEAMRDRTDATDGLKRTWRLACLREGIDPKAATAVPLLFAIDGKLGIEDGFHYVLDCRNRPAAAGSHAYCASHIGCGGGCGGGCAGSGCSGGGDGGCGGGGGD